MSPRSPRPLVMVWALACVLLGPVACPAAEPATTRSFEAGPLGKVYVGGVVSGLGLLQSHPAADDRSSLADISNGQLILQTVEGWLRFSVQAGIYSLPVVGRPYTSAETTTRTLYGPLPVAYVTLAPSERISIQAGKLPTLIGPEPTFTYQNWNIQRGLLWDPEPSISRGVQVNYTAGPLALSVSLNDGFYSGQYTTISGSLTWALDERHALALVGAGNTVRSTIDTDVAPVVLNNSQIYHLTYTYRSAPWALTAYAQVTHTPRDPGLGWTHEAQTYGGAVLVERAFTERVSLAGRAEVIASTGSRANGAPNLLYGPGSWAFTLTATPTFRSGPFFVRGEASLAQAAHVAPGSAFGRHGTSTSLARLLVETGVIF